MYNRPSGGIGVSPVWFATERDHEIPHMPSCVLAYSGGLDTSVILGWLIDQGHDVHAVYVDLGPALRRPPGNSREGAENWGPFGPDRRYPGRTLPRLRLSGDAVAGEVRGHVPAGHVDRPAVDRQGLLAGGSRSGADTFAHGATGKGNDQCRFQLAAEALEPGDTSDRPLADGKVPPDFPRPQRNDRLLPAEEHPRKGHGSQTLQLRRKLPAHQLRGGQAGRPVRQRRGTGRFRHDRLAATGPRQGRNA